MPEHRAGLETKERLAADRQTAAERPLYAFAAGFTHS
jgi:hypothetical protein